MQVGFSLLYGFQRLFDLLANPYNRLMAYLDRKYPIKKES